MQGQGRGADIGPEAIDTVIEDLYVLKSMPSSGLVNAIPIMRTGIPIMPTAVGRPRSAGIMAAMAGSMVTAAIIPTLSLAEKSYHDQGNEQKSFFHIG